MILELFEDGDRMGCFGYCRGMNYFKKCDFEVWMRSILDVPAEFWAVCDVWEAI